MRSRPGPQKPEGRGWQGTIDQRARRDLDLAFRTTVNRVKVRRRMIPPVHVDRDPVELGNPGHIPSLLGSKAGGAYLRDSNLLSRRSGPKEVAHIGEHLAWRGVQIPQLKEPRVSGVDGLESATREAVAKACRRPAPCCPGPTRRRPCADRHEARRPPAARCRGGTRRARRRARRGTSEKAGPSPAP